VAALPRWLVEEYSDMGLVPIRLGPAGIAKQIFLGMRESELETGYLKAFIDLAKAGL
jgi:LysR family transcriptional regulator, regulator for metE and metH